MYLCLHNPRNMLLAIDVGNTRIKVAVFENNSLLWKDVFLKEEAEKKIKNIFEKFPKIQNSVFSSVGKLEESVLKLLERNSKLAVISAETPFPFENKYETPKTLGVDRMVLASGATDIRIQVKIVLSSMPGPVLPTILSMQRISI